MEAIITSLVIATILTALYYDVGGGMIPGLFLVVGAVLFFFAWVAALTLLLHHRIPPWGFALIVAFPLAVHSVGSWVQCRRIRAKRAARAEK